MDLADIRKDVQCPICLGMLVIGHYLKFTGSCIYAICINGLFWCPGIIRKTRTVMECLHRFCRECIDKSMRLG